MESERPDALFRDPYARRLAGARGAQILAALPRGHTWAWPMIVRTAVIDELILRAIERDGVGTVLNLAAGLDARPYRPPLARSLAGAAQDAGEDVGTRRRGQRAVPVRSSGGYAVLPAAGLVRGGVSLDLGRVTAPQANHAARLAVAPAPPALPEKEA